MQYVVCVLPFPSLSTIPSGCDFADFPRKRLRAVVEANANSSHIEQIIVYLTYLSAVGHLDHL